ncbi:PAS domain S-box protein [Haloplanus salilacus]|uniref:PAS domain S-box protein n=1 Tax=Haloplanus salilacus TaxID=2949994 RepID=UPI0030D23549
MTATRDPLRVITLGTGDVAARIDGATTESGRPLAVTPRDPDAPPDGLDDADCLLVEQCGEAWREVVDRLADALPSVPVAVLTGSASADDVAAALETDANGWFPRDLCATQSDLVATRVAGLVEGASGDPPSETGARARADANGVIADPERRFRLVAENVDEIIYIANGDFSSVEYANDAYEDIWERPVAELYEEATAFFEGIDPRDRETFREEFESMRADIESGLPADRYEFEFRVRTPSGEIKWVHATGYPVSSETDEDRYVGIVEDVTEQRELERTYRELFESVSDGIVVHDPASGDIVDVNQRFCDLTGYDHGELVGETVALVASDDEAATYERAREAVRRGETEGPRLFEWRCRRADGGTVPVEVHLCLVSLQGERRVLASVRDITERRTRGARLRTERDRRSVLFENTPDPIMAVEFRDDDPYITEVNSGFADTFGFDVDDVTGRPIADVVVPEDEREGYEEIRRRALAGESVEAEVRRETATGVRDFLLRVLPFESGGDRHAYVWFTDVTERRERERAIEEEREKYSTLVEQSSDGVVVVRDGEYVFVNERFAAITGYAEEDLLGRPFDEVFAPESRELVRERYERRVAGESPPNQYDVEVETAAGERRTLELAVSRIGHEGDPATMANFRDVTERRERERTVEGLQRATERLQGAETVDDVYEIAVETARDVLGLPMTACWRHRPEADRLDYVTGTDPVERMARGPVSFTPDDVEYDLFEAGDATTYDPGAIREHNPLDRSIVVSIGDEGLLAAGERGRESYESYLVDVTQVLAGHAASALERVQRAEQLRKSEHRLGAIVDRIDEAIFLAPIDELDESDPAAEFVSSGYADIWGQSLETIQSTHEEGFFSTLHPDDYDGYRALIADIVRDADRGTLQDTYTREYRIERPDGEVRWVRSEFYPTDWIDGPTRIIVVSRDVTERKERAQTLESFHDATAELTTADTVTEAGRTAVEAAATVFDLPATAVYRYDEATGRLEAPATGPDLPAPDDLGTLSASNDTAWAAFVDERLRRVEDWRAPLPADTPGEEALLFPLGGNGLLVVWRTGDRLDTDAASILAATLEAALNRLRGERRLESRRAELEAQVERARRLESITELTRNVEAAITAESSRRGIQEAVCSELTDVEPFDAAWVVEAEVGTDHLSPRAASGIQRDDVERVVADATGAGDADTSPAADAWRTGDPVVSNDLVGGRRSDWRQRLLRRGAGSVCAVPLSYEGITHGVLTVVADEPETFGDREVDVLAQLGTSIGYAITATERQRALESDDTLELEFRGSGADASFVRLARALDGRVRHRRTVRRQDGSVSVYYGVDADHPKEVVGPASDALPGDVTVVSKREGSILLERRGSSWFGSFVAEYGGVLRRARATPDGVTLVVELPSEADTRAMVERTREEFPGLDLYAQRQRHETAATPRDLDARLERRLSDRQYEALETAHAMGYFEWPRENSGEDVADALGITQPTVNKHIRLGEGKVFDLLFGSASDPSG